MKIVGFTSQSFSDWRGRTVAVVFTPSCNFRCKFCHNSGIVLHPEQFELKDEKKILDEIKKNAWALDGLVILGGEPTLQPDLADFCRLVKKTGLKIRLDTNGSNPEVVKRLLDEKLIDSIAMDIKTTPEKYAELTGYANFDNILKTLELAKKTDHLFRTTVIPGVHTQEDLQRIADIIGDGNYRLQCFTPKNCLDPEFQKIPEMKQADLEKMAENLKFAGRLSAGNRRIR